MKRLLHAAIVLATLAAAPALAKDPPAIRQFKESDVLTPVAGKAYLLLRVNIVQDAFKQEVLFVRDLTDAEVVSWRATQAEMEAKRQRKLDEALAFENSTRKANHLPPLDALPQRDRESKAPLLPVIPKGGTPNVVRIKAGATITKGLTERTYLIEVPAGSYLIAGESFRNLMGGTCMCMGSLRFVAAPDKITDLGYVLAAPENKPSDVPEFAGLAGDPTIKIPPWAMTVRLPTPEMPRPPQAVGLPVVPAHYVAADKFPNYFGMLVNRMRAMPGILSYDEDRVIKVLPGSAAASATQ